MRKILTLMMAAALLAGCTSTSKKTSPCTDKNNEICFDSNTNSFYIEEGAQIILGGLPQAYGSALISLWNQKYPHYEGLLKIKSNHDSNNAIQALRGSYDIIFTQEELSGVHQSDLLLIDPLITDQVYPLSEPNKRTWQDLLKSSDEKNQLSKQGKTISTPNLEEELVVAPLQPYYVPVTYNGIAFYYNKTMLSQLGIDVESDKNKNLMPDSIESWENIFAIADAWSLKRPVYRKKPVNIVFPFSFTENFMSYFMFTSNGFRLFADHQAINPGFQSDTFAKALQFFVEAGKHPMAVHKDNSEYTASEYIWQWEKVYTSQIAPFGLLAPWMDITGAAKANKVEYVIAPQFPTFQGTAMVPFVTTSGYVIRSETKFPSAAHAVLQFLYSAEALQLMIDTSTMIPYRYENQTLDFTQDTNRQHWQLTLAHADSQPLIAMSNNVYKKALDGYFEIAIMDVVQKLWDGLIGPNEAQAEIQFMYSQWFFDNTKIRIPSTTTGN